MDVSNKITIDTHEMKNEISCARKTTREFNNKITDAELDNDPSYLPCKGCSTQLNKDAEALSEEIGRLQSILNDGSSPFFKCSCQPKLSDDRENNAAECSFDWRNVRDCISSTRKTMRDYVNKIDDGKISGKDARPCQTCQNGLSRECNGLEKELKTMKKHLNSVIEDDDRDIYSCMYGTDECSVKIRPRKQKGRQDSERSDSGYLSTGSKVLSSSYQTTEGVESEDRTSFLPLQALTVVEEGSQSGSIDMGGSEIINPKHEDPQKGPYLTIDGSLETDDGNSSTA